jgi:hypothetical protein
VEVRRGKEREVRRKEGRKEGGKSCLAGAMHVLITFRYIHI